MARRDGLEPDRGGVAGNSHYRLPPGLLWFSANIGVHRVHHVHHLSSGIPFYRLPEVLRNHPALGEVGPLSLWESFACVQFALWDEFPWRRRLTTPFSGEDKGRLVSFHEAPESRQAGGGAQPVPPLCGRTETDRG